MSSEPTTDSKAPKLPRITVSLDEFDAKIVENLVGYKGQNKSEVIRVILKEWISANPDQIQDAFGINYKDIRREIQFEKENKEIKDLVGTLPGFFKRAEYIEIELLADKLQMSPKILLEFIEEYGDELEKKGLNLKIQGTIIKKV